MKLLSVISIGLGLSQIFLAQPPTRTLTAAPPTNDATKSSAKSIRNPVVVPKIIVAPVIDGKLDDEVWRQAAVFKDFQRVFAGDNIVPSKPTEAYVAYDEKNLYVAF